MLQLLLFALLLNPANAKSVDDVCKTPISYTWESYQERIRRIPNTVRFKNIKYDDTIVTGLVGETPSAVTGLIDSDTPSNKYRPKASRIYKKMIKEYGEPLESGPAWIWFTDKGGIAGRLFILSSKNGPAVFTVSCESL